MRKELLFLLFFMILQGCSTTKHYYTFGDTANIKPTNTYMSSISVKKVDIPKYLKDNTLVRQVTPYKVVLIKDANWLTPMQKRLTNVLINYLQKSLNNPNVHLYPWETDKDSKQKISLKIKRFIAYKNNVILEASYKITDTTSKAYQTKLFTTTVATTEDTDKIMESMEKAYLALLEEIKTTLINNK